MKSAVNVQGGRLLSGVGEKNEEDNVEMSERGEGRGAIRWMRAKKSREKIRGKWERLKKGHKGMRLIAYKENHQKLKHTHKEQIKQFHTAGKTNWAIGRKRVELRNSITRGWPRPAGK